MASAENNFNVSREFLANAVGLEFDILEYKVTTGSKPGDNFGSIIYSADVKAKNKKGETVTKDLILKCYPVHPSRQEFTNRSNIFFKELEIYRLWIPELKRFQTEVVGLKEAVKLPFAPFVYGKCIDFSVEEEKEYKGVTIDPLENCIIMEDLRKSGFRMTNRRDCMDTDHIRLVIYELAKIHALSWIYKSQVEKDVCKKFPCLKIPDVMSTEVKTIFLGMAKTGLAQAISTLEVVKGPDSVLIQSMTRFQDIVETIFDVSTGTQSADTLNSLLRIKNNQVFGKDSVNPEPWLVIGHGDCWSNNMLFRYNEKTKKPEEVVLVDLQIVQESCIMPDIIKTIYLCPDTKLRKDHLDDLMKLYVDTFNGFCKAMRAETLPGFNLESFKFRFHRMKLFALFMAVLSFPVVLQEEEKVDVTNFEEMDHSKDFTEMMSDLSQTTGTNKIYNERIVEIIQEMYDEGVI